ncbi:hypothetical protein GCM10027422_47350 [Hymenobacter arcticus]
MTDPIATILTTAIEHAPSTAAVAATYKAAKPFLAKVLGPAVEELGEIGRDYVKGWRAKNGSAVLAGADKLLAEAGREPQTVPLKVLLPLLDAASLEDEPTLAEKWAALLANAADPVQQAPVLPGFIEVLRQLTPEDARVLEALATIEAHPKSLKSGYLAITQLLPQVAPLTPQRLLLVTSNLTRLGVCVSAGQQDIQSTHPLTPPPRYNSLGPGVDFIRITPFGFAFLMAATSPAL